MTAVCQKRGSSARRDNRNGVATVVRYPHANRGPSNNAGLTIAGWPEVSNSRNPPKRTLPRGAQTSTCRISQHGAHEEPEDPRTSQQERRANVHGAFRSLKLPACPGFVEALHSMSAPEHEPNDGIGEAPTPQGDSPPRAAQSQPLQGGQPLGAQAANRCCEIGYPQLHFWDGKLVLPCYKREQQKGQPGSCWSRARAIRMRSVAMDWRLCGSARTRRAAGLEVGRNPRRA